MGRVATNVARHDLIDTAPIGSESIHERRAGMKEPTEGVHVVHTPRLLKALGNLGWPRS